MRNLLIISFCFFTTFLGRAQNVWLHPNVGQWDKEILYSVDMASGHLYVDNKGFTYVLHDAMAHKHDGNEHSEEDHDDKIHVQVVKSHFLNSSWNGQKIEGSQSEFYRNYFIGNNESRWKSNVKSCAQTTLNDFYPGIDFILDGTFKQLKYSFKVKPGSDASQIKWKVEGANRIYIDENQVHIETDLGKIVEDKPMAWTLKDGKKKLVEVEYRLSEEGVIFHFPNGYDETAELTIDPYLVFSSFSGSTMDNWGMTATPDLQGNLYAGGIVFDQGGNYPVTAGAFDMTFNGGNAYTYTFQQNTYSMTGFDIALSKFNSTGSALIYSTYLGGTGNEAPHSLVTDDNSNLFVMGVTGSGNYPIVNGCFDVSFNGGPSVSENELGYPNGADIFVSRFNVGGSALVGSTFVGGSGTDGVNIGILNYNYGDSFRGEIIVNNGFVYVSSTTQSTNFPTLAPSQGALSGAQDAVIFKMNSALTAMSWSTYFGGTGLETGNSLQLASNGNVYVAGGTNSTSLPVFAGNDLSFNGGNSDGYLLKIQGGTATFMNGTYLGLNEYDQAYFVQLDFNDEVYVYGQTESAFPISAGVYGNPNSGQFIRKYTNNLGTILWTTMIGAGTGHPEISPTAFLVSDCFDIYISGWGGTINSSFSTQAFFSTSNGFSTTADAYQSSTNGSNFYIAVLSQNAATLKYATFMGGLTNSSNHVDGGTSRFDKSGRIYHAVCGACGGNDFGFTSTPGAWSTTNNSTNCNLAAFKFELSTIDAIVTEPQTVICLPNPVLFGNNSANGNVFNWDFGDGTSSTLVNPSHVYPGPGTDSVTLVVSDASGCYTPDSVTFDVEIGDFQGGVVIPVGGVCPGEPFQLEAYGGADYAWTPAGVLDDPTSPTPIATVFSTTTFTVIISDSCGADTLTLVLPVFDTNHSITNDTSICIGNNVQLNSTGGISYSWTPANSLSNAAISNPIATPTQSTLYQLEIVTADGCEINDSVNITVYFTPPVPVIPDVLSLCKGASIDVSVSGADSYVWSPNYQINTLVGSQVTVNPPVDFTYYCDFINACGNVTDSVFIDVVEAAIFAGNDTIICPGETAILWASGGVSYNWLPSASLNSAISSQVFATPSVATLYTVIGLDQSGCPDTAQVYVDLFPQPFIQTCPDVYALQGDEVQLYANSTTSGPYVWSPAEFLSCVSCNSPVASPDQNYIYTVSYTDENGCTASDIVNIYYNPIIYIPNTFTPNDDEHNQGFHIVIGNIKSFELLIFNRWGELIFTMDDVNDYWDGTYKELECQDGTYVWTIKYYDFFDKEYEQTGHVNLLR
ncbi:MAG: T9SS type B sorting domain-containing protein [Crocinitomicaceae bacterium]|nr:MAG: T9SS type B sorting domain-containing protein [Crocinitomicaceae bacterium]